MTEEHARDGDAESGAPCLHCPEPSRRRVVKILVGGALTAMGLPGEARGEDFDVLVGSLDELPPGAVKSAKYHGMPILLIHTDKTVEVLSAICTHEGCTVAWDGAKKRILCPCHGGQYDIRGKVLAGPPPAPLIQLPVKVEAGKIYVVE